MMQTPVAQNQRSALRSTVRRKFEAWLDRLRQHGCAALDYRLTGAVVERLCVSHFHGPYRVVVAFETKTRATLLLIGPHDHDPAVDIYTRLYRLAGIEPPAGQRTKPPCCGKDGTPPMLGADIDDLIARAHSLARTRRGG